ncbi:MAG: cobalamin-dependent protein [Candidatus Bathyarchaeia archaeon]
MKEALVVLRPYLKDEGTKSAGRVLIGTILGDVHDLGKSIAITLLTARGFEVIDLGVDVEPKRFAQEAAAKDVDIIGLSALLSTTQPLSREVVRVIHDAGLGEKVKIILGGAATQKSAPEQYGVDAAVTDALEGVNIIEIWMEGKRERRN